MRAQQPRSLLELGFSDDHALRRGGLEVRHGVGPDLLTAAVLVGLTGVQARTGGRFRSRARLSSKRLRSPETLALNETAAEPKRATARPYRSLRSLAGEPADVGGAPKGCVRSAARSAPRPDRRFDFGPASSVVAASGPRPGQPRLGRATRRARAPADRRQPRAVADPAATGAFARPPALGALRGDPQLLRGRVRRGEQHDLRAPPAPGPDRARVRERPAPASCRSSSQR